MQHRFKRGRAEWLRESFEIFAIRGKRLARAPSGGIQDDAAAESSHISFITDHEAIAGERHDRVLENELDSAVTFRRDALGRIEQDHPGDSFGGANKEADALIRLERTFCCGPNFQTGVEPSGRQGEALVGENVAPLKIDLFDSAEIQGDALAKSGMIKRITMHLNRAHARLNAGRQYPELLTNPHVSAHRSTGRDRAMTFNNKRAVDGQAEPAGSGDAPESRRAGVRFRSATYRDHHH